MRHASTVPPVAQRIGCSTRQSVNDAGTMPMIGTSRIRASVSGRLRLTRYCGVWTRSRSARPHGRGAALLLVLGRHLELGDECHPLLALWHRGGWVAVDLFFVLSGFLVSGLLFREYQRRGSLALSRFLVRRGLRIYPSFYLLLLCTWLAAPFFHTPSTARRRFLAEIFFVQNYYRGVW